MSGSGSKRGGNPNGRNGDKLAIPMPFEEALKAATEVPADKLPPRPRKQGKKQKPSR